MNGPEHYREAQNRLAQAHETAEADYCRYLVAKAQAHATLALAAATAEANHGLRHLTAGKWEEVMGS